MATTNGNVTVTTAATKVIPANSQRRGYGISNLSTTISIYTGPTSSVSATTGLLILPTGNQTDSGNDAAFKGDIYAIAGSTTASVSWWEWTA